MNTLTRLRALMWSRMPRALSLKLHSLLNKRMRLWPSTRSAGSTSPRAIFCAVLSSLAISSSGALAGGGGGMTGGATEVTQILNNVQLVESYAQQVTDYQNQLLQYQTMVQNLTNNPLGVLAPDVQLMANNASRLLNVGRDIASTMARVDQNFATAFSSPIAASFATKFNLWTNTSHDALKAAMLNAGLQREQFADDTAALQGLVDRVSASNGNLAALQALGSLNARQVQESMKLRDLISQQQVAQNTYLAAQTAKEKARHDAAGVLAAPYTERIPTDVGRAQRVFIWKQAK